MSNEKLGYACLYVESFIPNGHYYMGMGHSLVLDDSCFVLAPTTLFSDPTITISHDEHTQGLLEQTQSKFVESP